MDTGEWRSTLDAVRASVRQNGFEGLDAELSQGLRLEEGQNVKDVLVWYLEGVIEALQLRSRSTYERVLTALNANLVTAFSSPIQSIDVEVVSRDEARFPEVRYGFSGLSEYVTVITELREVLSIIAEEPAK